MNDLTIGQEIFVIIDNDHLERRTIIDINRNAWGYKTEDTYVLYNSSFTFGEDKALILAKSGNIFLDRESAIRALIVEYEKALKNLRNMLDE
jgi:hypothetical protein